MSGRRILENSLAIKNLVQDRLERKIRQEHWLALVVREHRGPDLDKRRNIFERSSALSEPGKDKERKRTEVLGQTGSSSREVSEAWGTAKFLRPTAKSFRALRETPCSRPEGRPSSPGASREYPRPSAEN